MALTKAQIKEILSGAGCPAENAGEAAEKILEGHLISINALREERENFKKEADKLPAIQKELDELKKKGDPEWQKKFEDEHNAFEAYKANVAAEKVDAQKKKLYRNLLTEVGIDKARLDAIIKVTEFDKITVKDDKLENAEKLKSDIESEWSGFIMKAQDPKPAPVGNPPANTNTPAQKEKSRAAQIAQKYHEDLYGSKKED